jgi:RimJ/RimL family protein N-acetyltransferase
MNDYEVTKFTEQKFKKHSLLDVRNFVKEKQISKEEFLYGIFVKEKSHSIHVGNIKLGPINKIHRTAEISYIIGNKKFWGKGLGTLSVKKIITLAKKKFKLKKLIAGCYQNNYGSINVLKKNLFKKEAELKSQIIFESKRISKLVFGRKI